MGHRNRIVRHTGHLNYRQTPACAHYGPRPGQEKAVVSAYLQTAGGACSPFKIGVDVNIVEQDVTPILERLYSEGSCVFDGEVAYAL